MCVDLKYLLSLGIEFKKAQKNIKYQDEGPLEVSSCLEGI